MDADYTARAKREAAAIIARQSAFPYMDGSAMYERSVNLAAQAWLAGYRAALEDQIGDDAA